MVLEQRLGFVATVTAEGRPNLSPKGTTTLWDEEHLMFADLASPGTIENLATNPHVEINVVDPILRKGYRFKGTAAVYTSGQMFDHGLEILWGRGSTATRDRVHSIVVIDVTSAAPVVSPAYDDGTSEGPSSSVGVSTTNASITRSPASRLRILKRLGVAWRLAQQLDLRFGPVEAHGPVNPDRLVPGIGDDHKRLDPRPRQPFGARVVHERPGEPAPAVVRMRVDRLEAGHAVAVGVEAQAGAQPPVEERAEPRPMPFVRQPAPRPEAACNEAAPAGGVVRVLQVRGRLEVLVTVQPAHLGVGVRAGRQTHRGRAEGRAALNGQPAAGGRCAIPSAPSVPSIPTETKSASGNISACSATAASRALASGANTKLPHQKSGVGGVATTVSPPCLVIDEPPSASNMMSVRKPSDAMGTETTVAGGHDLPGPNIITLSRGKRKPVYSEPPMPKRPRRLRTPLPRHGCDEIAAGIFTLRGVIGRVDPKCTADVERLKSRPCRVNPAKRIVRCPPPLPDMPPEASCFRPPSPTRKVVRFRTGSLRPRGAYSSRPPRIRLGGYSIGKRSAPRRRGLTRRRSL